MKNKKYGVAFSLNDPCDMYYLGDPPSIPLWVAFVPFIEFFKTEYQKYYKDPYRVRAVYNYMKNRGNGNEADNPSWEFPNDGRYEWKNEICRLTGYGPSKCKNKLSNGFVKGIYGTNCDGNSIYEYSVKYLEGPRDKIWMQERDKNYLARIEGEGRLKALEPAIWYLRETENAVNIDIRVWWGQKMSASNSDVSEVLRQAEDKVKKFIDATYIARIARNGTLKELEPLVWYLCKQEQVVYNNIGNWWKEKLKNPYLLIILRYIEIKQFILSDIYFALEYAVDLSEIANEIGRQCKNRVKAINHNNEGVVLDDIPSYDFRLNLEEIIELLVVVRNKPSIKILNLSNTDLSRELCLPLVELFRLKNDFVDINLTNTSLDNNALNDILRALYFNHEVRGIPLLQRIDLSGNQITEASIIIEFIHDCAHSYYWQQQQNCAVVTQHYPLTRVILKNNLIKLDENVDVTLQRYIDRLCEQNNILNDLTISLSGNIITIHAPNPFRESQEYKWRYGFFTTKRLAQRQSIMQTGQYLTPDIGFVYLVCKKNVFPGHSAIYTEMLNAKGQVELRRLDFFNDSSSRNKPLEARDIMLIRDQLYFQAWLVRPYQIQQLLEQVGETHATDIPYSYLGIGGHNCTTWAIEQLRTLGLQVDYSIIPINAVSGHNIFQDISVAKGF